MWGTVQRLITIKFIGTQSGCCHCEVRSNPYTINLEIASCLAMTKILNRINELFGIRYPIIQAGMVWCAPWELASAVSNAGGLGLIGSASMYPDVLRMHIQKCKAATDKTFGVNVALMYPDIDKHIQI